MLLTGCLAETFSGISAGASTYRAYMDHNREQARTIVVAPPIVKYSQALQTKAAAEIRSLSQPCARDVVYDGCSAASRLILDYQLMRDQARSLGE